MTLDDLWKGAAGGTVVFLLTQSLNGAKLLREYWRSPKLKLCAEGGLRILSHELEQPAGREFIHESKYAVRLRNTGRTVATGVRFQLLELECKKDGGEYRRVLASAAELKLYVGDAKGGPAETVILPRASVTILLGTYRSPPEVLYAAIAGLPHYYEEACQLADSYRFTIAAYDD